MLLLLTLLATMTMGFVAPPPGSRSRPEVAVYVFDFVKRTTAELGELIERKRLEDLETVARFSAGLEKSRNSLVDQINAALGLGSIEDVVEALEETLLTADIGYATTEAILEEARERGGFSERELKAVMREQLVRVLESAGPPALRVDDNITVISVIGSNGMGKTTTIGKLAKRLIDADQRVLVAACDTFRAAAVDQLSEWTLRAGADLYTSSTTNSPSAVAYEAMAKACAENYDVVLVDTSGRLANNVALTEELKKVQRTIGKFNGPTETLLVLDAAVGRNALDQARIWRDEVGVTGLVVTKLDGTSRAGFCVSVVNDLKIPVKLVGVGETIDDLRDFDATAFVDSLLDIDDNQKLDIQAALKQQQQQQQQQESAGGGGGGSKPATPSTKETTPNRRRPTPKNKNKRVRRRGRR
ncbi:hypothetical protein CTAYLR_004631 [Chrysophaeum taylorii]|uniref:SRP54-type proteins GTP-binding domain-containing protein n=1 Tax=Chrysophaeum taylorii TaxID=2483200 RepID=A0AAD7UQK1_9STRA|nr:hypothetical protein CTAYLR_004631 [Chrysophaeum taylorii]